MGEPETLYAIRMKDGKVVWERQIMKMCAEKLGHQRKYKQYIEAYTNRLQLEYKKNSLPKNSQERNDIENKIKNMEREFIREFKYPLFKFYEVGFTSSTPVATKDRIYVRLASGYVACLDIQGNLLWANEFTMHSNEDLLMTFASPILVDNIFVVTGVPDNKKLGGSNYEYQVIEGFDANTGKKLWTSDPVRTPGWTVGSPVVISLQNKMYIVTAGGAVIDLLTGKIMAKYIGISGEASSPVVWKDTVFFCEQPSHGQGKKDENRPRQNGNFLYAVRLWIEGNELKYKKIWERDLYPVNNGRTHPSPLYYDGVLYVCERDLLFAAFDALNGECLWNKLPQFPTRMKGRPPHWRYPCMAIADYKLYISMDFGEFGIIAPSRVKPSKYIGIGYLNQESAMWIPSRMCFYNDQIYVRSFGKLYCIGK